MIDRPPAVLIASLLALLAGGLLDSVAGQGTAVEPALPGVAEWNQYRGDPLNQGVSHSPRPRYAGQGEGESARPFGLKWKYFLGDGVTSTPAFADGKVVVCTESGMIHVVEGATGHKAWGRRIAGGRGGGFVFSSPLIRDGRIYVGAKDHHLYCVDLQSGEVHWAHDAGKDIYAAPKGDARGIVFSTADGQVICLDPQTGERRWRFHADREIGAAAAIWGQQLLIPGRDRTMYRIDYGSGACVEEIGIPGATHCTPCIGMGYAFLICGGRKSAAIDLFGSEIAWEGVATGDHKTPCAYFERKTYLPLGKYVYCVNGATGEKLWEVEAENKVTAPLINAGELIFAGKDGSLRVHDRSTGEEVVTLALGEQFIAGPILVDGTFYLAGSKSYLYAVE